MKLNQVIAISNGEKTKKQKELTKAYQKLQKSDLFAGLSKRYRPKDEDGENFKNEDKYLQLTVHDVVNESKRVVEEMFNIVATQDLANCTAKADIVVNETVIVAGVPVTHLLFLEKQLTDLNTFIQAVPTLDPAEQWDWSTEVGGYISEPKETHKTKKVPRVLELAKATDKHPAQVQVYNEDVTIGYWTTIKYSGCISKMDKNAILDKIESLSKAVKIAREEANSQVVVTSNTGTKILDYIFG